MPSDVLAILFRTVTHLINIIHGFNGAPAYGASTETLGNLNRTRVRLHWAKARREVLLVRPYAFFWYEYAGKQLCAPGGRWAKRDRTAFEAEFNEGN